MGDAAILSRLHSLQGWEEIDLAKKRKKKELTFAQMLQRSVDKHNKRARKNMELYRALQKKQGKKPDEPISLMDMIQG